MTDAPPRGSSFDVLVIISVLVSVLVVEGLVNESLVERNLGDWVQKAGELLGLL
jgi:hypothetical protein